MSHDEENEDLHPFIEPELEARVVAWVLGEASAFEAAEMKRLVGEKPELAIFKRRIEAVHGLVGEAARRDTEPMRLAPERRQILLEAFGATEDRGAAEPQRNVVVAPVARPRRNFLRSQAWMATAACLAICVLLAAVLMPKLGRMRESSMLATAIPDESYASRDRELETAEYDRVESSVSSVEPPAVPAEERLSGGNAGGFAGSPQPNPVDISGPSADGFAFRASGRVDGDKQLMEKRVRRDNGSLRGVGGQIAGGDLAAKSEARYYIEPSSVRGNYGQLRQSEPKDKLDAPGFQAELLPEKEWGQANEETILVSAFQVAASDADDYASIDTISGSRAEPKNVGRELRDAELAEGLESNVPVPVLQDVKAVAKTKKSVEQVNVEEISATDESVSTFSLHVSDVSFRLAQAALARGEVPDPETIRPEEFYNAFDYGEPAPMPSEKIACRIEQAAHPFLQQRNLVRVAMRVPATGRGAGQPLRLTVLLDTSGSMERGDRAISLRRAIEGLASLLGSSDRVNLIGFARQPRLLAEQLPGDQSGQLLDILARTPSEGGTNLEEALRLASELARRHHDAAAQNRIVLITDGAANLGNADPGQLAERVETLRQQKIAFDACGVGTDGLDDAILEALTRKGDGRYYVLDSPADADAGFARQLAGAFRPAAENVKVQVRFNPARVGRYRLIGFEQHRLREEDFRNDAIDAAELAAEEAAVALYQIEVLPEGDGELGEVYVRFRDAATGGMVERSWTMHFDPRAQAFDRSTLTLKLAGTAALLAEKLRGGELAEQVRLAELAPIVNALRGHYANDVRVGEMVAMFEQMRRMTGE